VRKKEFINLELRVIVVLLVSVILLVTGLYYIMFNQYYTVMIDKLKEDAVNVHKYSEMVVDERSFLDLNTIEDQSSELYIVAHRHLDEIRRIANIRYLYTAKLNDAGELIYVVDGLDENDELFRNIGDLIEDEIIAKLMQCMDDEVVLSNQILNTEWGIVYVAYFPFHDSYGNVIGAIGMEFDCENLYYAMNRALSLTLIFSLILTVIAIVATQFVMRKIVRRTEHDFQNMEESLNEVHERAMLMLDTSPLCAQIWDKNLGTIDCNEAAVRLYGFKNKQEYIDRFIDNCSPEFQPDGRRSDEKAVELVQKAFEEGYCIFDWMHKMPDSDTLIPAEVTLVRTLYKGEDVVVGYTRDMRNEDKMMMEIEQRDKLLRAVNRAAAMLLTTDEDEDPASMITESMELIGTSILADRIHIWRYKKTEEDMFLTNRYSWLSERGATKAPTPQDWSFILREWPGWLDQYERGICTNSLVTNLLPDEKSFFESLDVKSIVIIPLFLDDEFWGLFSIDDCEYERVLPDEEIKILHSVSLMMATVINRQALIAKRTQELALLKDAADTANRSKSLFLASMSHEIRTPMNAILGAAEIMMQSETLSAEMMEWLSRIYTSGNLLLGIINDILDLSKIEAGKLDIIASTYQPASVISDAAQLNILRSQDKPIMFELNINENLPAELIGDELRIKQILNNLLSNAFKFTDTGSVTLSVDFESGPEENSLLLILSVKDTGYGMTKEHLEKLFDEYSRFDNTEGITIEGTGLGLSITRRLIHSMDGDIRVESEYGKGSEFTVRIPQKISSDEVLGTQVVERLKTFTYICDNRGERRKITRDLMPYGSVLIVDDVETNRFVATGLLRIFKLQIDTADSGFEAIKKSESGIVYDVIFMDHMMPGMDGVETTKRLRDMGYTAPIVALTANVLTGQSDFLLNNGFDDFIAKPIDIRVLTSLLNRLIRDKQPPEVLEEARRKAGITEVTTSEHVVPQVTAMDIPGIDVRRGVTRYDGDTAMYLTILRSYAASVGSILENIASVNKDDLSDYRLNVHSIKGASFDIFADIVGSKAEELESAAKEGDFDYIDENNKAFVNEARRLVDAISAAISVFNTDRDKPVKDKPDSALLGRLRAACELYVMDEVDAVMAELDSFKYDNDDGLMEWLRNSVDTMSFSQIAKRLSEYN